jgi:hypothetical protein
LSLTDLNGIASLWTISDMAEITLTHEADAPILVLSIEATELSRFKSLIVPERYALVFKNIIFQSSPISK